jgi:hypothetical protein
LSLSVLTLYKERVRLVCELDCLCDRLLSAAVTVLFCTKSLLGWYVSTCTAVGYCQEHLYCIWGMFIYPNQSATCAATELLQDRCGSCDCSDAGLCLGQQRWTCFSLSD